MSVHVRYVCEFGISHGQCRCPAPNKAVQIVECNNPTVHRAMTEVYEKPPIESGWVDPPQPEAHKHDPFPHDAGQNDVGRRWRCRCGTTWRLTRMQHGTGSAQLDPPWPVWEKEVDA